MTFTEWMKQVDIEVSKLTHMSADDLDDMPYTDWHRRNISPRAAARKALKWTMLCYRPDFAD